MLTGGVSLAGGIVRGLARHLRAVTKIAAKLSERMNAQSAALK